MRWRIGKTQKYSIDAFKQLVSGAVDAADAASGDFSQEIARQLAKKLKPGIPIIVENLFDFEQVLPQLKDDLAKKISLLQALDKNEIKFSNGLRLPIDVLSLLPDPSASEAKLIEEPSPEKFRQSVQAIAKAYQYRCHQMARSELFYRGAVINSPIEQDLKGLDLAGSVIAAPINLCGRDCSKVNMNAVKLGGDSTTDVIVHVDTHTKLTDCQRNGLRWGKSAKLHYTYHVCVDQRKRRYVDWTFEDPKALYLAIKRAYKKRRKEERVKNWFHDYFDDLEKQFGQESFEAKLFEVICYVQDNPKSRTAEVFHTALEEQRHSELQEVDYQQLVIDAFRQTFGDDITPQWNEHLSSSEQAFVSNVQHYEAMTSASISSSKLLQVSDYLKLICSEKAALRSSVGDWVDDSLHPARRYQQQMLFLRAKIASFKASSMNVAKARAHTQKVLQTIDCDVFIEQYQQYQAYLMATAECNKRVAILAEATKDQGEVTHENQPPDVFQNDDEKVLYQLNTFSQAHDLVQVVNQFIKNLMLQSEQPSWVYLTQKKRLFSQMAQVVRFVKDAGVEIALAPLTALQANCAQFILSHLISDQAAPVFQADDLQRVSVAYALLKSFECQSLLAEIHHQFHYRYLALCRTILYSDIKDRQTEVTKINQLAEVVGGQVILTYKKAVQGWGQATLQQQYDMRLNQFLSLVGAKSLAMVDVDVLSAECERKTHRQLTIMQWHLQQEATDEDKKYSYIASLVQHGYWQDAEKEQQSLQAAHPELLLRFDELEEAIRLFSHNILNEVDDIDPEKMQRLSEFLASDWVRQLMSCDKRINSACQQAEHLLVRYQKMSPIKEMIKTLCVNISCNHSQKIFAVLPALLQYFSQGQLGVLALNADEQSTCFAGLKIQDEEQVLPEKRRLNQLMVEVVESAVVPLDLLRHDVVSERQQMQMVAVRAFYDELAQHQATLCNAERLILQSGVVGNRLERDRLVHMERQYFLDPKAIVGTFDKFIESYIDQLPVCVALESALAQWQLSNREQVTVAETIDDLLRKLDRLMRRFADYKDIESYKQYDQEYLAPVKKIVRQYWGSSDTLHLAMSYLAGELLNVHKEQPSSLQSRYHYYLYIRAFISVMKENIVLEADLAKSKQNYMDMLHATLSEILQTLAVSGDRVTVLGYKQPFFLLVESGLQALNGREQADTSLSGSLMSFFQSAAQGLSGSASAGATISPTRGAI